MNIYENKKYYINWGVAINLRSEVKVKLCDNILFSRKLKKKKNGMNYFINLLCDWKTMNHSFCITQWTEFIS